MATAPMSRATLREWIDPDKPRFFPITDPAVADAPPSDVAHSDIEFTRPDEGEEDVAPPPPPPESGKKVSFEEELALLAEMSAKLDTADSLDKLPADASQDRIYQRALDRRRFLRARKHDVNAAVEMYIKCLEWRRDNGIDTILDNPDPLEAAYQCNCSHRHFGFDREGHPVYWERTGHVRVGEMLKSVTEEDVVRRHVRMMEYALRRCQFSSQRLGRNVEKIIMIQDLTNLSYAPEAAALRIFRQTCRVDQDYYPERLQRMILINAPLSFRGIWAIIRPWVDPKTASKVLILGTNFHEQLREIVDPSQTPAEFGGDCHIIFKNGDGAMPLLRSYPDPNSTPAAFDLLKKPSDDEDSGRYLTEEEIAAKIEAEQAAAAAKKGGGMFGFFRRS